MILDRNLRVSNAQALTTTAFSTDTIDLLQARDIGEGERLFFEFDVNTALTGGTSVTFEIVTSANANLSSPTVIAASAAIVAATLVAGYRLLVAIPPVLTSLGQRYLGVRYTIAGTFGAGTVTANVVKDMSDPLKFYPSGFAIS